MNNTIDELWDGVHGHPLFSEEIADKIKKEIKVGVAFGSNRFTLTRNLLTQTLTLLNMIQNLEDKDTA